MKLTQILLTLAVLIVGDAAAQNCSQLGQNPGSAFPVCGTTKFRQLSVPVCGNKKVPNPCNATLITDKNPFWYKFTCYTSGTLGFKITPANLGDDYDWQLFDVTGESPSAVYSKSSLFVACNWSGESGITGASDLGSSLTVCEGFGQPLWSSMPDIIVGHDYLLLISHFTDSQSGYSLTFEDGTADITDPKIPAMTLATGVCKGDEVRIKLNKQMKCSSIAADGSDFSLSVGTSQVIAAKSVVCDNAFSTDTIALTLDKPLPAGDYAVNVKAGSDGNSLLDNCDNDMPNGSIGFTVHQNVSAQFTYNIRQGCVQDTVDFSHDGAYGTNKWNWDIEGGTSTTQNTSIIYNTPGDKTATLTVSNDYCTDVYSATIPIAPRLDAKINAPDITCAVDAVTFTDGSAGNINSWLWDFGNGSTSTEQNPESFKYTSVAGEKPYTVRLVISNDIGCADSTAKNIIVVGNCNILVPSAFTPNNDGKNDYLFPTNAFGADNLIFRIYNRFGQLVFETRDWQKKWDGNVNGQPQNSGTYVWYLSYTLRSTGRKYNFKGTTLLVR
jgi:gliding motility-associated-like protein